MRPKYERYTDIHKELSVSDFSGRPSAKHCKIRLQVMFVVLFFIAGLTLAGTLAGCSKTDGVKTLTPLTLGAASSLTEPLKTLSELYEANTGIRIQISFASSGTLRKQVEEGAPLDLLILASSTDLKTLSDADLLLNHTTRDLLSNQLCFVSNDPGAPVTMETLPDRLMNAERIALGDPASVPAGKYATESLESLGVAVLIEEKQLYAKDARQVLQYLNTGAVDAGFLFASDAALLEGEFSVLILPDHTHSPILYPAAVLSDSQNQTESQAFLDFLGTEEAIAVFEAHGFSIPPQP